MVGDGWHSVVEGLSSIIACWNGYNDAKRSNTFVCTSESILFARTLVADSIHLRNPYHA
jgi:hypothetical protein